jgi:hypothetical protein
MRRRVLLVAAVCTSVCLLATLGLPSVAGASPQPSPAGSSATVSGGTPAAAAGTTAAGTTASSTGTTSTAAAGSTTAGSTTAGSTTAGSTTAGSTTAGSTTGTTGSDPASCNTPPSSTNATAANRDRFISLWLPRVTNQAWLQQYLNQPTVPADIAAEGFVSMDQPTQAWLVSCLVAALPAGSAPAADQLSKFRAVLFLVIFGKDRLNQLRAQGHAPAAAASATAPQPSPLQAQVDAAAHTPLVTKPAAPTAPSVPGVVTASGSATTGAGVTLKGEINHSVVTVPISPNVPLPPATVSAAATVNVNSLINLIVGVLDAPPIANILAILNTLLTDIANVQQVLFTVPPLNLLGGVTYRVCAESATQPLACSVSLPVGVPIPADVNGDHVPDVLAELIPSVNTTTKSLVPLVTSVDVGFSFEVLRLFPGTGALPAHVFAVYDPPTINTRLEYGYDGRQSTLANDTKTTVLLKNAIQTPPAVHTGDIEVTLAITHASPGAVEAETLAVKTLQPQGAFHLPKEVDPMTGAVQFSPVPTSVNADLHLIHSASRDEDIVSFNSSQPSTTNIDFTQDVTSQSPQSHRQFRALVDQLPTSVTVDLVHVPGTGGGKQTITYNASAGIAHVHASDNAVADTSHPGSFTRSDYDVQGVPSSVAVTLTGSSDIVYQASAVVPQVQFTTQTQVDNVVQNLITATAKGVPKNIHLNNNTAVDNQTINYDADSSLTSVALALYDRANDQTFVNGLALGLPTHATIVQTKSSGAFDYSSSGPIGTLAASLSRGGGSTLLPPTCVALPLVSPASCVDHATFFKRGSGLGVDAKISGLVSAHADPSQRASYRLGLSPGGQQFLATADLDSPNVAASLTVSNLPTSLAVTMDPAVGSASYQASSVINSVSVAFAQRDSSFANVLVGRASLGSVPKNITLGWSTAGATPSVTYSADSRLGSLQAFYQQAPGQTTFSATVADLPLFMRLSGLDPLVFSAQTSAAAAAGSDHVGTISFAYGSDGVLTGTGDPNDHVALTTTGTGGSGTTHAELLYHGLSFFTVDTTGKQLHGEVKNTAARLFDVALSTPNLLANGFINSVPTDVVFDVVGQEVRYNASSVINEISLAVDRRNGEQLNADVTGIPGLIDLTFDSAGSAVTWNASGVTGGVNVTAQFGAPSTGVGGRTFNAALTLAGIPASWDATYGTGHVLFKANGGGSLGTLAASFTNHGVFVIPGGDGLSVDYSATSGDLDASLQVSKLTRAEFQKLAPSSGSSSSSAGGFDATFNMGVGLGETFGVNAHVSPGDGSVVNAVGGFTDMPTQLHLRSQDAVITYNGNLHPTLQLDLNYGDAAAVAALPVTAFTHGIVVRDAVVGGGGGGGRALGAKVFLTGLPLGLSFDTPNGIYTVSSYAPTVDALTLDVQLTSFAATPIALLAVQHVFNGGDHSPVDFTFGPFTTGVGGDGGKLIHAQYTASRPMGAFNADATADTNVAQLSISNIPRSVGFDANFGADTKTINVALGDSITEIDAAYKRTTDSAFIARAQLTTVPKTVALTIGKQDDGQGIAAPLFNYHASAAGLGLFAFVDASAFSGIDAQVQVTASGLGQDVTSGLSGTTMQLASSPATGSFMLVGTGVFNFNVNLGFNAGPFTNTGNLAIHLNVGQLIIGFTDMTSLTLKLGVSTAIEGNYGSFTFGETSVTTIDLHSHLDIDLGIGTWHDAVGVDIDNANLGNVIGDFRMADNVLGEWFSVPTPVPCDVSIVPPSITFLSVDINLRPHPRFTSTGSMFTVSSSDTEGSGVWIATVNPEGVVPDFVLDIIARFASPDGGDQGLSTTC